MKLAGAQVLLTGGGRGLGRYMAERLAADGAGVHVLERDEGLCQELMSAAPGLQALLDGKIDLLIDRAATSWVLPTEPRYGDLMSLDRLLTEESLAWAVRKGDEAWRQRIYAELARMRQTGVLQHILGRWVPVQPQ